MGRRTLLTAGLALLVLGACGPIHPLSAASAPAGTIPWKALPADLTPQPVPSPQARPVPPGTPACKASDLAGVALGSQGATGHVIASFALAGTSTSDCFVDGTPAVTVRDAAGRAVRIATRPPFFPPAVTGPQLVSPGPVPDPHAAVKYGEASLSIDWVSQPEACAGQGAVTISTVVIAIAAGGSLTIALPPAPQAYTCQGLGVGSFESPPVPVESIPVPDVPSIKLGVQSGAYPGKPFEYLVTLTNDTNKPMSLASRCPNYEEEFFADPAVGQPLGGKHLYMLNCAPVGTLVPGASRVFQMIFDVPAGAAPGSYMLLFGMGYWNAMTRFDQRAVVVLRG